MRITAGSLRGRNIHVPDIAGLRPTPAKVRQALFNILGGIEGWQVLDLFAGSGLMALESISRGAETAISIEQHHKACDQLQKIRSEWQLEKSWRILPGDVLQSLSKLKDHRFDLIFADPPYEQGIAEQIPAWLEEHGISCRWLVVEEASRAEPIWPAGWTLMQSRRYGDTCLHFLTMENGK